MRVVKLICLCLFCVSLANAQAKRLNEFHIGCRGWKTLAFAGEKSAMKDLDPMGIDGVEVRLKSHKLEDEQIVFVESCDPKPNEEPTVEDAYWGRYAGVVREFTSYEVQGRVFAYRFTYYVVQAKNGYITTRAGAAVDFYYLDEKGNGTFEQYLGAMPLRFLPDWVKARPQKP